jgi:hypothetical protein
LIAASDNATSSPNIQGPASSLADSTLLELTANSRRFADLGSANNLSGRSGIIKIKTPGGRPLGCILLYITREGGRATTVSRSQGRV